MPFGPGRLLWGALSAQQWPWRTISSLLHGASFLGSLGGLSLPMYALYELSILSVRMVERQRAKKLAAEAAST